MDMSRLPCESWVKYREAKGFPLEKRVVLLKTHLTNGLLLFLQTSYKGRILDLGGCDNLVNTAFVTNHLKLEIQTDTSMAVQDIQRSENRDSFRCTSFVIANHLQL